MPTYLVRTSDMKLVRGSDVHEGYCTLSYSWGQSGEVRINETTGKSYRIDQGKHKIIYSDRSKFVTFEGLIQELCKDFNIKYIWYDQMCINQDNEKEKHAEIHHMHKIYGNSYCALALMPELRIKSDEFGDSFPLWLLQDYDQLLLGSQWMKRMWTLEEAIMSSKMVVVGQNMHSWGDQLTGLSISLFNKKYDSNASRVLYYAHTRTSTKEHDHVFALANIFPDIMKQITVNYKQDIQELMIQFYGLLAKTDISILCFKSHFKYLSICKTSSSDGAKDNTRKSTEYHVAIQEYDLPSWTGVDGEHYSDYPYQTSFKNYTVNGRTLQVTCAALTNNEHHTKFLSGDFKDMIPPFPHQESYDGCDFTLVVRLHPQKSTNEKWICVHNVYRRAINSEDYPKIVTELDKLSQFISIKKTNLEWASTNELGVKAIKIEKLEVTESLQHSSQYLILVGVLFEDYVNPVYPFQMKHPIVKKEGDYYKSIGTCETFGDNHFFDDMLLEEQTFEIR
ncbi:hypothetical protein BDC45DRAFT_467640 [Circinella umbellata]|nr:hypothetical protein BDC45DRAFT_467640 [Circinella umbellata]